MIPTEFVVFDGVSLEFAIVNGKKFPFEADTFKKYPTYCGPGKVGDKFVSDNFYGVNAGVVCHNHDIMRLWPATQKNFDQYNEVLLFNLNRLILAMVKRKYRTAALQQAVIYYHACQNWGRKSYFKKDKKKGVT